MDQPDPQILARDSGKEYLHRSRPRPELSPPAKGSV